MTVSPIHGQGNLPQQVTGAQGKSGEEAFNEFTKSEGYNSSELQEAVRKKTQLARTRKTDKAGKKHSSLFLVTENDGELFEEPVYRTVMVDGILFTLRLLAVA